MAAFTADGTRYMQKVAALFRDRVGASRPPTADFTFVIAGLTVNFTDASTDPDVKNVLTYSWTFGDGGVSVVKNPSRTYAAAGTYNVTLTVTDSSGQTGSVTKPVTV